MQRLKERLCHVVNAITLTKQAPTHTDKFLILLLLVVTTGFNSIGQLPALKLRSGLFLPQKPFVETIDPLGKTFSGSAFGEKVFLIIQCKQLLTHNDIRELSVWGMDVLEYIPNNSYLVRVSRTIPKLKLDEKLIANLVPLDYYFKLDPALIGKNQVETNKSRESIQVRVIPFDGISSNELQSSLQASGINFEIIGPRSGESITINLPFQQLSQLSQQPSVYYVEEYFGKDSILNDESNVFTGAAYLQNTLPSIGRGLTGKGVVIGMGDNGGASHHIDHYYKTIESQPSMVYHSTHVAGILAGAGLLNPKIKGRAPEATLIVGAYSDITQASPQFYNQYGMVLTNNSYGSVGRPCDSYGIYSSLSRDIDRLSLTYPQITHVYAAGNISGSNCSPYPPGYFSMFPGPQSAKNTITVGAGDKSSFVNQLSKGPIADGRIKPEISSIGFNVLSTVPPNIFGPNTGTSMAAPQVTGALALLVQRYRQLYNGQNPHSGLVKNLLLNAASELGSTGPDFANGYGSLNAKSMIELLESGKFYADSISHQQTKNKQVTIGSNVHELRIMLSWQDQPASLYALKSLVNDLDIKVTSPSGQILKPLVLDPSSALNTAIPGEDHLNNIEQIIIRDPEPGTYLISVNGYEIPMGPQTYFVSYQTIEKKFELIAPQKRDKLKQGETVLIQWENTGVNSTGYQVDFSLNNGSSWQTVGTTTGLIKYFRFKIPDSTSAAAVIRVRSFPGNESVLADSLSITPEINFSLQSPCDGFVNIKWTRRPGIDSVNLLQVKDGTMTKIWSGTDSSFLVRGLSIDSVYWFSVQPFVGRSVGERSIAQTIQPIGAGCNLNEFDGDIRLVNIVSPTSGRKNTSTEKGTNEPIVIKLKNLDDVATNKPIYVKTFLNNNLYATDTIVSSISASSEILFTLGKTLNLTSLGRYNLVIKVEKSDDPDTTNNVGKTEVRVVDNQPLVLPVFENFATLTDTVYRYPSYFALEGKDNWDFTSSEKIGYLQTRVRPGKPALLPSKLPQRPLQTDIDLRATYNLSGYTTSDNIFLTVNSNNRRFFGFWSIRGSDTSAWVNLSFTESQPFVGSHANITRTLQAAGQQFSSSFQLRTVVAKSFIEIESPDTLFHYEDIRLYKASDDVKMISLRSLTSRFFVGDTATVLATVSNNMNYTLSKVPITIRAGSWLSTDTIPTLKMLDTIVLTYRIPITSINSLGVVDVRATADLLSDTYPANNQAQTTVTINPVNSIFPYYEGFESGNNGWTASTMYGTDNLWRDKTFSKPANGKNSFYTNKVTDQSLDIRSSTLVSIGLDVTKLSNPYLSFSTKRYLRLGIDSAQVQISLNRGQTWQKLNAPENSNWYNASNKTYFSDSDKVYWHGVTCKLPDTVGKIMIRIISNRANFFRPFPWLGNIAVDDIHIYSLDNEIISAGKKAVSGLVTSIATDWTSVLVNSQIVAAVKSTLSNTNSIKWEFVASNKGYDILNGQKLLPQKWIFTSESLAPQWARIRLYFTDSIAEQLRVLNACNNCADTVSAYHFNIYQFVGNTSQTNNLKHDNPTGKYRTISSDSFNLVPFGKGYYAEFEALPLGEFYVQVPERYDLPKILFRVVPKSNKEASISWSTSDESLIEKYEIELANGTDNYEQNNFTLVKSVISQQKAAYEVTELSDFTSGPKYYRLKITHKNGYSWYSPEQVIDFAGADEIKVYPNPSQGVFNIQLNQTVGDRVQIQVVDSKGRILQKQIRTASGTLAEFPINLSASYYAPGVYYLRIINGISTKSIKLIKL